MEFRNHGTETHIIKVLLGHESPKTTAIYAHVSQQSFDKIKNPLDRILEDKTLKIKPLNND